MMSDGRKTLALPAGLANILDGVRRRHLAVQVAEFPVLLVAFIAIAWPLQGTADRALELSWGVRALLLALNGLAALALLWLLVIVRLRQQLDRKKAALLVERTLPQFKTSLISAVELSEPGADYPAGSQSLVEKLLADTARAAEKADIVRTVVDVRRLKRYAKWTAAVLILAIGCSLLAWRVSPVLVQRILLSNVRLPADTQVVSITQDLMVIAGNDANLISKAQGVIPAGGRLIVIPASGAGETIAVSPSRTEEGIFQYAVRNVREPFTYHFELNDGVGSPHRVEVRVPPVLGELRFVQTYPKHTGLPETVMSPANLKLLEGSKLRIEAKASEALQLAALEIKGAEAALPLKISGKEKSEVVAELNIPGTGWKSLSIHLVGASGNASVNDPVYRVDLTTDHPPSVQLMQPKKENLTVVAGARVPFVFKVSDDFGLTRVALVYKVMRPGLGGVPEGAEMGAIPITFAAGEKSFSRTIDWDLARLVPAVTSGCAIHCWIESEDNNPAKNAITARSSERVITLVSEQQKRMELLDLLGERAKDIERLYELQRGMNEKTDNSIR